jgi:hypothetical protein
MIIYLKDTQRFFDFLQHHIKGDYRYKYLNNAVTAIHHGAGIPNGKSYIHEEDDGWLIYLHIDEHLFVYGNNWSKIHISRFTQKVDLKKRLGSEIMGTYELVYPLLKRFEIDNYKVIKDRCFYRLSAYAGNFPKENIELADPANLDELTTMFQAYYTEEYNGERNKSAESLSPTIERLIKENLLYVIKDGGTITSFCSLLSTDIGIVFTKEVYRGQGLGGRLLAYCSWVLFERNGFVNIMTDMHNVASNKICTKIGYDLIYKHTNLQLPSAIAQ